MASKLERSPVSSSKRKRAAKEGNGKGEADVPEGADEKGKGDGQVNLRGIKTTTEVAD